MEPQTIDVIAVCLLPCLLLSPFILGLICGRLAARPQKSVDEHSRKSLPPSKGRLELHGIDAYRDDAMLVATQIVDRQQELAASVAALEIRARRRKQMWRLLSAVAIFWVFAFTLPDTLPEGMHGGLGLWVFDSNDAITFLTALMLAPVCTLLLFTPALLINHIELRRQLTRIRKKYARPAEHLHLHDQLSILDRLNLQARQHLLSLGE